MPRDSADISVQKLTSLQSAGGQEKVQREVWPEIGNACFPGTLGLGVMYCSSGLSDIPKHYREIAEIIVAAGF